MRVPKIPLRRWVYLVVVVCLAFFVLDSMLLLRGSQRTAISPNAPPPPIGAVAPDPHPPVKVDQPMGADTPNNSVSKPPPFKFTIIILSMDRFSSLNRLLKSLKESDYQSDQVDLLIRFDLPKQPTTEWRNQVNSFRDTLVWNPGSTKVVVAEANMGLRRAWLEAWKPTSADEHAIILEDDIEVSPLWYKWIKGAHVAYQNRTDLVGISLQRQTLVPLKASPNKKLSDNGGKPFLYKLVGSIGYSPVASIWLDFLEFAECALASNMKVDTPGLITSDWYNQLDQRTMWTQLFIYFCKHRQVFTLYMFPQNNKALAAHLREKGEHFQSTVGRDFELANVADVTFAYPADLVRLDWNALPEPPGSPPFQASSLQALQCFSAPSAR